jgi:MFS family permease
MSPLRRVAYRTFSSLSQRNFRLFLTGQLVSMSGTWMQTVALGWLVLELTGSGLAVGVNLGLQFLPMLLFGMWGGLAADRYDKRKLLMFSQSAMGVVAFALFALSATGVITIEMIYVLTFLTGCATALDNPARQSFVTEMVGSDEVANAVSLNSAVFNASRILGPALAGLLITTVGIPPSFLINGISYFAVVVALQLMNTSALRSRPPTPRSAGQVRDGLAYVWRTPRLRYTVLLMGLVSTFGINFSVVLPLMARFEFHKGAETFGLLTSMMAFGALIGALVNAARAKPTKRLLVGSAATFGALVLLAAIAPSLPVLVVLLVPIGAATITFIATANSTLQLRSSDEMRGRVMALHGLVFLGSTPIGAPVIGWISESWGPRAGLAVGGVISLAAAVLAVLFIKREEIAGRLRDRRWIRPGGLPDGTSDGAWVRRHDGDLVHPKRSGARVPGRPRPPGGAHPGTRSGERYS